MKQIIKRITYVLPQLAKILGGGSPWRQFLLYVKLVFAAVVWKCFGNKPFTFQFQFNGYSFTYDLEDSTDIAALEEIYLDREYAWALPVAPKIILDLGANYGDTTLYYRACYPEALIIAVEPSQNSYERLKKHTGQDKKIIAVQAALSADTGDQNLYLMPGSSLGHSMTKRREDMHVSVVPGTTLASLQSQYTEGVPFDLIKFDIEGAEQYLFRENDLKAVGTALIGEIHFDLMDVPREDIAAKLTAYQTTWQALLSADRYIVRALRSKEI